MTYRTALSTRRSPAIPKYTCEKQCLFFFLYCFALSPPSSHSQMDETAVVNTVQHFLKSCQPFFNKLDTVARNTAVSPNLLPCDVYKKVLKNIKICHIFSLSVWTNVL